MKAEKIVLQTTQVSVVSSVILCIVKWIAGVLGCSHALIADAIESTTDIITSLLVFVGLKYANKPADKNHPYGHGRIEPLITFLVVGFLVVSAGIIAYKSIQNIRFPHQEPKAWTLWILGLIVIWKEGCYQYVIRKSRQLKSSSLRAEAWHHRSDAITSVAAFIGISIAVIFGKGYEAADDWAALFSSFFILYNGYQIFRPAFGEIMDEHLYDTLIEHLREESLKVEGVLGTEKCFVRKIGMRYHIELHAIVDGDISVREGHKIAHHLKDTLKEKYTEVEYVVIHIEPDS